MPDLIIDLVRHMHALSPGRRAGGDDARPLSKLGQRQAEWHATAMDDGNPILALYSSPALRCRQTLEPLAKRLGLQVRVEPLLAETRLLASLPIGAENPLLTKLLEAHPGGGRVVACSHADTIPAFIGSLGIEPYVSAPAVLQGFGGWYRVRTSANCARKTPLSVGWRGAGGEVSHFEPPPGFPQA